MLPEFKEEPRGTNRLQLRQTESDAHSTYPLASVGWICVVGSAELLQAEEAFSAEPVLQDPHN